MLKTVAFLCISLAASAVHSAPVADSVVALDGNGWLLAPDPKNVGVAEKWWEAPRPEATQRGLFDVDG